MSVMQSLQRQLLGLIGRAVVKSINAASKCQMIDVELLAGQQKAGIEHLESYGFTSRAKAGAEAVVLFPDGDRSHAVAITVSDRHPVMVELNQHFQGAMAYGLHAFVTVPFWLAVAGVVVLALGAYFTVIATQNLVKELGISTIVGGLFITAPVAALPEAFAAWSVARSGQITAG